MHAIPRVAMIIALLSYAIVIGINLVTMVKYTIMLFLHQKKRKEHT